MATFVLVHGAFQGGWVWRETAEVLHSLGHVAFAPTLTGCGYLHHGSREGTGLHDYIDDVSNFLAFEEIDDAVLVAHSFSGMICSAVMMRTPHLLRRVVFVDAIIPDSNRTFVETAGEAFRHMLAAHRANGWRIRPWPLKVFGVSGSKSDWFRSRLADFPEAPFHTPFPGEFDPSSVPASHIACRETTSPFIRAMADKARAFGWPVAEMDGGHCPMVGSPETLADLLVAAVGRQTPEE